MSREAGLQQALADSIDISSGAFKFGSWQKGTQLTMVKNPPSRLARGRSSTGSSSANLARASQFQALKSRRGSKSSSRSPRSRSWTSTRTGLQGAGRLRVPVGAHRLPAGAKAHPALKQKYVRQAIIQGINRHQIRERPVVSDGPRPVGQGPPGPPEPHLQAVRAPSTSRTEEVGVQPEERPRTAEEERVHRRPGQADREQLEHLQLPERRQARFVFTTTSATRCAR